MLDPIYNLEQKAKKIFWSSHSSIKSHQKNCAYTFELWRVCFNTRMLEQRGCLLEIVFTQTFDEEANVTENVTRSKVGKTK
jgi:hypothetical protein